MTGERAQQVAFTIPYYREGVGLMLKADGKYADYAALKEAGSSVTVSVLQNVYAEPMVRAALPKANVDQYESVDLIYQALASGRRRGGHRPVLAGLVHDAESRPLQGRRLRLEPADLRLRRQARRPGLAQLRQHGPARSHDRRRIRRLRQVVQDLVRQDLPPPQIGFPVEYR